MLDNRDNGLVEDVLSGFNFEVVRSAMVKLDWRWGGELSVDDNGDLVCSGGEVPSVESLRATAKELLTNVLESDGEWEHRSCAGFTAIRLGSGELWLVFGIAGFFLSTVV